MYVRCQLILPSPIETIVFGSRSDIMSRRHMMAAAIALMSAIATTGAHAAATTTTAITDPVLYWNNQMLSAIRDSRTAPPPASRVMAMMHTAVFDAVNAASGNQYKSYTLSTNAYGDADPQVAAAVAAHRVLVQAFPAQVATLDAALANYLASGANSPAAVRGAELGKASADAIISARSNDGAFNSFTYKYGSKPGDYQNTAGNSNPPAFQQWPDQKAWTLTSKDQYRPDAPPPIDSEMYASAAPPAASARQTRHKSLPSGPMAPAPRRRRVTGCKSPRILRKTKAAARLKMRGCLRCCLSLLPTPQLWPGMPKPLSISGGPSLAFDKARPTAMMPPMATPPGRR
jgi:hypothetical protein